MAADIRKHRRQAAWLCFEPHLSKEQLVQAIAILEQGFQQDGVNNLITYVTHICTAFGIDTRHRKLLYSHFHELMSADLTQSPDPLSVVLGRESYSAPNPTNTEPEPEHAETQLPAIEAEAEETDTPAETTPEPLADHTLIFIHFVKKIVTNLPDSDNFFSILGEELAGTKSLPSNTSEPLKSWLANPDDFAWSEGLSDKALASIVHLFYTGLCELLGPVAADDSFHRAIASCEQLAEAKRFNPARFL
jgi:hypothetical protein